MTFDDWDLLGLMVVGFLLCLAVGALLAWHVGTRSPFDHAHRNAKGRSAMAKDLWK